MTVPQKGMGVVGRPLQAYELIRLAVKIHKIVE